MHPILCQSFEDYPQADAPFMHEQRLEWRNSRPLEGLRVLHHVPVVPNTLLKIACLIEAGADVTVSNPSSFCQANPETVAALKNADIRYVEHLNELSEETFDLYFDCGAELYQALGKPTLGAIELTGSGDQYYRQQTLSCTVISIDQTLTKQLETVFGCAESCHLAISQLTGINPSEKSWLIVGFGKIGRGLAYFCVQNNVAVTVVDTCEKQRKLAESLGILAIDPQQLDSLENALKQADIVVTATGKKAIMNHYPHTWFSGKILANLGVYDEYGPQFSESEVLNDKKAINFILTDPTPMKYIDPEFYLHNIAALALLPQTLSNGLRGISSDFDRMIIKQWCTHHVFSLDLIEKWFIPHENF